jgi:hypothetical protein
MLHQTMTYSKTHQKFSEHLKNPDVLTDPGKYLGPNWEDVLNFWIYIETLSDKEKEAIADRFLNLDDDVRNSAFFVAEDVATEIVGEEFRYLAWHAAYDVTEWTIFGWATYELISHHKILEQNKTLTFLPLTIKKPSSLKRSLNFLKNCSSSEFNT